MKKIVSKKRRFYNKRLCNKSAAKARKKKSQVQELFESRGHFFLIGAACHAELAYKEHGWDRLKAMVKPYRRDGH